MSVWTHVLLRIFLGSALLLGGMGFVTHAAPHTPESTSVSWGLWGLAVACTLLLLYSLLVIVRLHRQLKQKNQRLAASEQRLLVILNSVDAHIYIKDKDLRYLYINQKFCDFFNLSPHEIIGKTDVEIGIHPRFAAILQHNDRHVIQRGERIAIEEKYALANQNQNATFFSIKLPLHANTEQKDALCGISTDITAYKATREANHQLAFFDPLTELPNRRLLLSRLNHMLEMARQENAMGAVLIIDVDNFKQINEARGHSIGDIMLKRVALRLTQLLREHDTVARVGGDEFVILLPRLCETLEEGRQAAQTVSERVRLALEQPFLIHTQSYFSSVSIGVSFIDANTKSVEDVWREADTAMYRSKEAGRNRVAFYHKKMKAEIEERFSLGRDLIHAMSCQQLDMYLQPQHNLNHDIIGVELLARWHHPERGLIPPERFIPIAEENRLISDLGDWALAYACRFLLRYPRHRFTVSINISPAQFKQYDFLQRIQKIITRYKAPANRLIFEITEGMLMEEEHQAIRLMEDIVKLGVRFAIDDFGTGYSNLAALKKLPLYELKIDRSLLVKDINTDEDSAMIVRTVLAMGRQLRLHVVAEGVETKEQALFLSHYRCSALQGYFFSPAMPLKDWSTYLKNYTLY